MRLSIKSEVVPVSIPVEGDDPVWALHTLSFSNKFVLVDVFGGEFSGETDAISLLSAQTLNVSPNHIPLGKLIYSPVVQSYAPHVDLSEFVIAPGTYTIIAPVGWRIAVYILE